MRLLFTICFTFLLVAAQAQSGHYFLSHYSPKQDKFDNVCFQMIQLDKGVMYFATRNGIMQFDGRKWDAIHQQTPVYTLQHGVTGKLFWGGASGYGVIEHNSKALPEVKTLSNDVKNVFQSVLSAGKIYFVNEEKIYILNNTTSGALTIPATALTGAFLGIYEFAGGVYVNTAKSGVLKIVNDKTLRAVPSLSGQQQLVFASSAKDNVIIGLSNNKIYTVSDNLKLKPLVLEDQEYLNKSVIVNGSWVNKDLIVLGTLRGGLVFVNPNSGKTQQIINYSTGLPDNEVFSILIDKTNGIWAAHEYGFTRILPYLPFRSFSYYPGLHGNLLCATSFNSQVYAGTSLGLFKLEREDVFDEIDVWIEVPSKEKRKKPKSTEEVTATTPTTVQEIVEENESKRKGFFSFLRKKKPAKEEAKPTTPLPTTRTEETPVTIIEKPEPSTKILTKERVYKGFERVYKKVRGVEAKVTQLLEIDGHLIATGLGGTFEINDTESRLISDTPARHIFTNASNWLFIATYNDEVKTFRFENNKWQPLTLLQHLNDQITHIFETGDEELWLCALDKVYRLNYQADAVQSLEVIEIANPNYDQVVGMAWKGQPLLCNAQGFFSYNPASKSFVLNDSLGFTSLSNYFAKNNTIFFKDIHSWNALGHNISENLGLLNLFPNVRQIVPDQHSGNLWIITNSNELYQFYGDRVTSFEKSFPLYLKSYRHGETMAGERTQISMVQANSALTFEVVQPDFLASSAVEYRYRLKGLEKEFSSWSTTHDMIDFPYLPEGDYALEVQSRDIFGRVQDMVPVKIEVLPPYWQRPWFYALEFILFAMLVVLSFRLNARYRIVSRLLMLLTIILLIQFIETVVSDTFETRTSPVIDFIIQVVVAMLVLPVEGYLRVMMLSSLDKKRNGAGAAVDAESTTAGD